MNSAGIYPQPLIRTTFLQCPLVPGYTTARLSSILQFGGTTVLPAQPDNSVVALLENTGDAQATVQFRQTNDDSPLGTGVRSNVGAATVLVPGGRASVTFTPTQPFLEVTCTAGSVAQLRAQLQSQLMWNECAFAKADPLYPKILWQPANLG